MTSTKFERPDVVRPTQWVGKATICLWPAAVSNNTCTFCNRWGEKLQMRDLDAVKKKSMPWRCSWKANVTVPDIPGLSMRLPGSGMERGCFLLDCDALVYPFPKLKEVLDYLNRKLPFIQRIGAYATAQDVLRRSIAELKELPTGSWGYFTSVWRAAMTRYWKGFVKMSRPSRQLKL